MVASRLLATVVVSLLFLGIVGCGPTLYQPSGKLTKSGAPLKLSEKAVLEIALFAESDAAFGEPYAVSWEKDGAFKVVGRNGGIPAGKYKMSIVLKDPYSADAKDVLEGRMAKGKGPVFEVKNSSSEIVVDLDKK